MISGYLLRQCGQCGLLRPCYKLKGSFEGRDQSSRCSVVGLLVGFGCSKAQTKS